MKEFWELVDIIENNDHCVLMKVKPDSALDLIKLGCFEGDEDMIRFARDNGDTITIFTKNGNHYSWTRGTLVSDSMWVKRRMIMNYVHDWANDS